MSLMSRAVKLVLFLLLVAGFLAPTPISAETYVSGELGHRGIRLQFLGRSPAVVSVRRLGRIRYSARYRRGHRGLSGL